MHEGLEISLENYFQREFMIKRLAEIFNFCCVLFLNFKFVVQRKNKLRNSKERLSKFLSFWSNSVVQNSSDIVKWIRRKLCTIHAALFLYMNAPGL